MSNGLTEAEVRIKCKRYLKKNGWYSPAVSNMGYYCTNGFSDSVLIKNGIVIFCEFKREKGWKQSDDQKNFQREIESHGGTYWLVNSLEVLIEKITGDKQLELR